MKKILLAASAAIVVSATAYATPEMSPQMAEQKSCMIEAILFEAGNQSIAGKYAVAKVIMNRVKHKDYPNNICDVVHQGPVNKWFLKVHNKIVPVKHKCQFSYYCDGKSDDITPFHGSVTYNEAELVSAAVMSNFISVDLTEGSLYYHADYVSPAWSKVLKRVVQIGNHIFYK